MTTLYIRKDGSDSAPGNGTSAHPYLTLYKALSVLSLGGGHTILLGDGLYEEDSGGAGYMITQKLFTDWVTIQPEGGALGSVTISNNGHTTWSLRGDPTSHLRFKWLNLTSKVPLTSGACGLLNLSGAGLDGYIEFIKCNFSILTTPANTTFGFLYDGAGRTHFVFEDCTMSQIGTDSCYGIRFGGSSSGVVVRRCNITMNVSPFWFGGALPDFLIDGGRYIGTSLAASYGALIGKDGSGGSTITGIIQNAYFKATGAGHALIIGSAGSGVQLLNNQIDGLDCDQGLVLKECDGTIITANNIQGGAINALYFKAATNAVAEYNTIFNNQGNVMKVGYNSVTGNKSGGINFQRNRLYGVGSSKLLYWGGDSEDLGGGICDHNVYSPHGSGKLGAVKADAAVASMAALRAAWAGYGGGSNDSHSRILQDDLPMLANTIRHHR